MWYEGINTTYPTKSHISQFSHVVFTRGLNSGPRHQTPHHHWWVEWSSSWHQLYGRGVVSCLAHLESRPATERIIYWWGCDGSHEKHHSTNFMCLISNTPTIVPKCPKYVFHPVLNHFFGGCLKWTGEGIVVDPNNVSFTSKGCTSTGKHWNLTHQKNDCCTSNHGDLVGALEHEFYDFPLGMSSSQLTFTPSFFRGVAGSKPPTRKMVTILLTIDGPVVQKRIINHDPEPWWTMGTFQVQAGLPSCVCCFSFTPLSINIYRYIYHRLWNSCSYFHIFPPT